MIIAQGIGPDGELMLLLGLSRENVRRLMADTPIHLSRKTHGESIPQGWCIEIMFGETELEMGQKLRRLGALNADTKVRVDPRLGS